MTPITIDKNKETYQVKNSNEAWEVFDLARAGDHITFDATCESDLIIITRNKGLNERNI